MNTIEEEKPLSDPSFEKSEHSESESSSVTDDSMEDLTASTRKAEKIRRFTLA